ncbi:MAG: VOC family protein [Thermotogota bacterium]
MRQSIAHIASVVKDYDEAIDFYTNKLNFELIEDTFQPEQDKRWVVVAPPNSKDTTYKKYLTKKEEEIAEKIWNAFGDMSSKKLGDEVTHKFNEWKNTNIGDNTEFDTKGIEIFKEYF